MLHKRIAAALLAAACALPLGTAALAKDASPTLSGESETTAYATIYDYQPLVFGSTGYAKFGNTIYCTAQERINADGGSLYRLTDSTPLAESGNFRTKIQPTTNAQAVKSVKLAKGQQRSGTGGCFKVELADDYLYRDVIVFFDVTYTALRDVALPAVRAGDGAAAPVELTVKKDARLKVSYSLNVSEDALFTGNYDAYDLRPAWYGDVFLLKDPAFSAGVDELILTPEKDRDADLTWREGDSLVAQVDYTQGSLSYSPKLSTEWADAGLVRKRSFGDAYVRIFRGGPAAEGGTITLTLTNPFLTFEGEETVPHKDVVIYELKDGKLSNVTSRFRYGEDTEGTGAFLTTTDHLGSYVLANQKL